MNRRLVIWILLAVLVSVVLYVLVSRSKQNNVANGMMYQSGRFDTVLRSSLSTAQKQYLNQFTTKASAPRIDLPLNYDCRERYPGHIGTPLDQAKCGSCWAFSVTGSLSDRIRMESDFFLSTPLEYTNSDGSTIMIKNALSPYFLAACDFCQLTENDKKLFGILTDSNSCNQECGGGILQYAMIYASQNGLITMACNQKTRFQYTCHDVKEWQKSVVPNRDDNAHCYIYYFSEAYQVNKYHTSDFQVEENQRRIMMKENERAIMTEIFLHGPVSAGFAVYNNFSDFFAKNPDGVYVRAGDTIVGGHAIVIIGWGEKEDGDKYWICRNSWSTKWADGGFFKIRRGENFCEIENDVFACLPDWNRIKQEDDDGNNAHDLSHV